MGRPFYYAPYIPWSLFIIPLQLVQNIKSIQLILSIGANIFCGGEWAGVRGQFGGLSWEFDILFSSDNHFCQRMEREDLYFYSQNDEYGDNFLSSLLDNPPPSQEDPLRPQAPNPKEQCIVCEEEAELNSSLCRDLLNKELSNNLLPDNPYEEQREDEALIITPESKKTLPDSHNSAKKDHRLDKIMYQQQSRAVKVQRYLSKKRRRVWEKKVSYDCRKLVADKRQRVNGRFIKKSPFPAENSLVVQFPNTDIFQMLHDFHSNHSEKSSYSHFMLE